MNCTVAVLVATIGAAVALAQPEPIGGSAVFNVFSQGQQLGQERVTLSRTANGWTIRSTGRLMPPVDLTTHSFELRYAPDWQPIELKLEATLRGQPLRISTSFGLTTAISEIFQGNQTTAKTDELTARSIVMPSNNFAAFEALAARLATARSGDELRVYVVPQGEVPLQVRAVSEQRIQTPAGVISVRRFELTFHNPETPLEADVWVDGHNRLARIDVPSASLVVAREDLSSVVSRAQAVARPGDEDVAIPASGFNLAATISRPTEAKGELPAIVLVGAPGPQDRDLVVAGIPIFGQLAGALADARFLVVRYDPRGVGQSGGRPESATLDDYAEDVRSVVRYLDRRRDVDDRRIAVVGYDKGGAIALSASARENKIAALVLVAAAATTGDALVLEQQRLALDRLGLSDEERQEKIKLQQRINAAVTTGKGWDDIPADVRWQADTPWFRSFLSFDPVRTMSRVRQPVLVVHGLLDREVPPGHADRLVEFARQRRRAAPADLARLDALNHLLLPARTGEPEEYARLEDTTVSPEAVAKIAEWCNKWVNR